jgi:hypothetical protein
MKRFKLFKPVSCAYGAPMGQSNRSLEPFGTLTARHLDGLMDMIPVVLIVDFRGGRAPWGGVPVPDKTPYYFWSFSTVKPRVILGMIRLVN